MTENLKNVNVLPGASSLGYGFNIATATSPTTVKSQIINLNEQSGTTIQKFGIDYLLPANVSEIDRNKNSILYNSFASESQYCNYMSAQASGSGSGWGFSAEFEASYSHLSKGETASFYGLVEANSLLWDTQLKSITGAALNPDFITALNKLPLSFNRETQMAYYAFFDVWGTHVINQSQVGGSLNYVVAANSSSDLTEKAAAASMEAEYKSLFVDASVSAEAEWKNMSSGWVTSRNSQLSAIGGTPGVLNGMMGPTKPEWNPDNSHIASVTEWTSTLPHNPGVISVSLTPISDVISGIGGEYHEASKFLHISNQFSLALASYLNAPITVLNTSSFTMQTRGAMPFITGSSSRIIIDEETLTPANKPRSTDLSLYWVVMADENGNVTYNNNYNTENPDDFDRLITEASALSNGKKWWVAVCIVNQTEAPISLFAAGWLKQIGIDPEKLQIGDFYPGMSCVISMVGKTNSGYQRAVLTQYQPYLNFWSHAGQVQDIITLASAPAFIAVNR